jgi:F0F1-type ATP synthase membrane subunit b/b'
MAVAQAALEERKTRGTKAHHQAMLTLNKAIREQTSLQKEANKVMAEAAKNSHETAKATADVNRQQAMLNTTMTASNSWLAAQVRTAGVTAAQQNSFIEVPVIIDGQTLFRVVQKHSLVNNRRNVSNGLARSGSTIG